MLFTVMYGKWRRCGECSRASAMALRTPVAPASINDHTRRKTMGLRPWVRVGPRGGDSSSCVLCLIQQAAASAELLGDAISPVGMLKTCEPLGGYDKLRLCGVSHGRSAAGVQLVSPCPRSPRPKASRHRAEPSLLISPERHGGISPITPTNQGKPWSFTVINNEKNSVADSQA